MVLAVVASTLTVVVAISGYAASLGVTSQKLSVFMKGVVLDQVTTVASSGAVRGLSWSHTVGQGSDRILVVGVSLRKNNMSVSSISYGGVGGFVKVGTQTGGGADHRIEIWYKLAPPVGTATVAITFLGGPPVKAIGGSASFTGVNQTTPVGSFASAFATSKTPSVTVTSASGDVVIAVLSISGDTGTIAIGPGQTERWRGSTGSGDGNEFGAGSTAPGAASVTMSWSFGNSNTWVLGAVPLKPA